MNKKELLEKLATACAWNPPEPYITTRGKVKVICTAPPSPAFKALKKDHWEAIKALGITMRYEWVTVVRTCKNGLESRKGGRYDQTGRKVKQWEIVAWIGPRNTGFLSLLGFTHPDDEGRDFQTISESVDAELEECPF